VSDLVVTNRSPQDVQVVVRQDGKKHPALVRAWGQFYFVNAEPTPELEAMCRSRHLNVSYRIEVNKEADDA